MSYPEWGTALIECANPPCTWRGLETDMIPDPAPGPKAAPSGCLTSFASVENVCPTCKKPGYYFVKERQ